MAIGEVDKELWSKVNQAILGANASTAIATMISGMCSIYINAGLAEDEDDARVKLAASILSPDKSREEMRKLILKLEIAFQELHKGNIPASVPREDEPPSAEQIQKWLGKRWTIMGTWAGEGDKIEWHELKGKELETVWQVEEGGPALYLQRGYKRVKVTFMKGVDWKMVFSLIRHGDIKGVNVAQELS